jgi:hypothetical protein
MKKLLVTHWDAVGFGDGFPSSHTGYGYGWGIADGAAYGHGAGDAIGAVMMDGGEASDECGGSGHGEGYGDGRGCGE